MSTAVSTRSALAPSPPAAPCCPHRRVARRTRVLAGVLAGVAAVAVLIGQPRRADAHGVGGVQPTNYETNVAPGSPGVAGVHVAAIDLGERIELSNRGPQEVTVLGYQDEPYLRIGPDGVFENTRSPATYLNRTLIPTGPAPASADPSATPAWRKVSDTPVARWHDHRSHWMGPTPKVVRDDPKRVHELTAWSIPLLVDDARGPQISGTLRWEPSVSPWPWILSALMLAGIVGFVGRLRFWRALWIAALLGIAIATLAIASGTWRYTEASFSRELFATIYNLGGIAIATTALWFVARRSRTQVAPLVLLAGVVALFGTGLAGLSDLSAPFIPSAYPTLVARVAVTAAVGLGLGLTVGAAQFLKLAPTRHRSMQAPAGQSSAATPIPGSTRP